MSVVIVESAEVEILQRWRRFALLGWIVAGALALLAFWALGTRRAYAEATGKVNAMTSDVRAVSALQQRDREALVQAWTSLQRTTDSVLEMGTYIQERRRLIDSNREGVADRRK